MQSRVKHADSSDDRAGETSVAAVALGGSFKETQRPAKGPDVEHETEQLAG